MTNNEIKRLQLLVATYDIAVESVILNTTLSATARAEAVERLLSEKRGNEGLLQYYIEQQDERDESDEPAE